MFVDFIVRGFDPQTSDAIARLASEQGADLNATIKALIAAGIATIAHERDEDPRIVDAVSGATVAADRLPVFDERVDEEILAAARLIP